MVRWFSCADLLKYRKCGYAVAVSLRKKEHLPWLSHNLLTMFLCDTVLDFNITILQGGALPRLGGCVDFKLRAVCGKQSLMLPGPMVQVIPPQPYNHSVCVSNICSDLSRSSIVNIGRDQVEASLSTSGAGVPRWQPWQP